MKKSGGPAPGRRETRARKVSQRVAVVDESTRQQYAASRLEQLEADNADDAADALAGADADDGDFLLLGSDEEEVEVSRKRKRKSGAKRRTRGALDGRGPKSFQRLLEESRIEDDPPGATNYLTAAAGPSRAHAPRKFCSVCGFASPYTCARCGLTYCSRKCCGVHVETKCMKLLA